MSLQHNDRLFVHVTLRTRSVARRVCFDRFTGYDTFLRDARLSNHPRTTIPTSPIPCPILPPFFLQAIIRHL